MLDEGTPTMHNIEAPTTPATDTPTEEKAPSAILPDHLRRLAHEQHADPTLSTIIADLDADKATADTHYHVMKDGLLYHIAHQRHAPPALRLCVPRSLTTEMIRAAHDGPFGHTGAFKTYDALRRRVYWRNMFKHIKSYVRTCDTCQRARTDSQRNMGFLTQPEHANAFSTVWLDHFGPLPLSTDGNRYVLHMVDNTTRWRELIAVPDATSETTARTFFRQWVCRYGPPLDIGTDRGPAFRAAFMRSLTAHLGIKPTFTTAYHPSSNPSERHHRPLKAFLRAHLLNTDGSDWERHLPAFAWVVRSTTIQALAVSPYELTFGRQPRTIAHALTTPAAAVHPDAIAEAAEAKRFIAESRARLRAAQSQLNERVRRNANKHRRPHPDYRVNDLVLRRREPSARGIGRKLLVTWDGPHRVVRVNPPHVLTNRQANTGAEDNVHVTRVAPYRLRGNPTATTAPAVPAAAATQPLRRTLAVDDFVIVVAHDRSTWHLGQVLGLEPDHVVVHFWNTRSNATDVTARAYAPCYWTPRSAKKTSHTGPGRTTKCWMVRSRTDKSSSAT